jgi:hypothetical protein
LLKLNLVLIHLLSTMSDKVTSEPYKHTCDFLDNTGAKCNNKCPSDCKNKQECMYCEKNIVRGCGDPEERIWHCLPNVYIHNPPDCTYWKYAPCEECIVDKKIIRCPNCHLISMNACKIDIKCMKCQHPMYIGCALCDNKQKVCRQCYIKSEREKIMEKILGNTMGSI